LASLPWIHDCDLERDLGAVVPDIFLRIGDLRVAIEVQISALTMNRIIARTNEYHRLGVHVLWLPLFDEALNGDKYSPRQWEKWLHATYFGRIYYWLDGLSIAAVHFDEHLLYRAESTWYEDGVQQTAGGYYRTSKRHRTPNRGPCLNLPQDFMAMIRPAWTGGDIAIPDCSLLIDKREPWWECNDHSSSPVRRIHELHDVS